VKTGFTKLSKNTAELFPCILLFEAIMMVSKINVIKVKATG